MMRPGLGFMIATARRRMRGHGLVSLAAVLATGLVLAGLVGSVLTAYRLHQVIYALPHRFEIAVFLRDGVSRTEALSVKQRIAALPEVADVQLVTKEQAWTQVEEEALAQGTDLTGALEGDNPLPDRLDVRVIDPYRTAAVADQLRTWNEIDQVRDERATLEKVLATLQLFRLVSGGIALLLFGVAVLVIRNTLRFTILAYREEMDVMRVVGAAPGCLRGPIVGEALLYGTLGGALGGGILLPVVYRMSHYAGWLWSPIAPVMPPVFGPWIVLSALMGIGILTGLVSSTLSLRPSGRRA